ncbi:MAG: protein arginine kinase [Clostridiales bacterium GWB2_37_7]|nr:MAG: protein arginine kinase [Clostridiales bacterium GWB2_37_7]
MSNWIKGGGPSNDIILSSRVRLARNLANTPFPSMLNKENGAIVIEKIYNEETKNDIFNNYTFYDMQDTGFVDRYVLVERHLISPNLANQGSIGAALVSDNEEVSIMLNEEDHIRIQSVLPGLRLKEAWSTASIIDDQIESKVDYAFDERLGYLTSCPTNVGTGLRASIMIHLPGLNISSNINKILNAVTQVGLTIRGIYGEGTEFIGNIFQISNQITLGRSEEETIDNLTGITEQIIDKEKEARKMLLQNNKTLLEDKVWRAWGIMTNARCINGQESMKLLSEIRLGVDMGILNNIPTSILNEIMVDTNNASLQKRTTVELNTQNRDIIRAEEIRKLLLQQ